MLKTVLRLSSLSFFLFLLLLGSCKKDEPAVDNKLLLAGEVSKTWIMTGYTSASFNWEDQPECVRDDLWIFYANGTMEQSDGPTKCDPDGHQIYGTGTWTLNDGSHTLSLDRHNLNIDAHSLVNFTIETLTESTMVLKNGSDHYDFQVH